MNTLVAAVENILDDIKAQDVIMLDVHELTTITAFLVICTGRSKRHIASVADHLVQKINKLTDKPKVQGLETSEWVIVDINDIVVHILLPEVREIYQLEKLWDKEILIIQPKE